ncbi:hypothetical protein DAI22_04g293400 [Oryza sativa Japonica Group]|nr:hypothetical protein DAI22_04g293400 [Oryza sativa Japonica Group]
MAIPAGYFASGTSLLLLVSNPAEIERNTHTNSCMHMLLHVVDTSTITPGQYSKHKLKKREMCVY